VLIGRVVTMNAKAHVHERGAVCVDGDRIAAVVSDPAHLPEEFADLDPIETHGTIYPGLIHLHDHLSYNFLPLWTVPRLYSNRNIWREKEPDYFPAIKGPANILGSNPDKDYPRSIARFVECRAVLGGTTTTQGLSAGGKYYKGLTRNVEAPNDPAFPKAGGRTLDYQPSEIETDLVPALKKDRPFFYHLSEGTAAEARQRFFDLEYTRGRWAIDRDLILIHCTGLHGGDFERLRDAAGLVWSPLSNFLLYGKTTDVEAAKTAGVPLALGADWSPSGSKNLLGELKIARHVSDHLGGLFTAEDLVRMVTTNPAKTLGWDRQVGALESGLKVDLLILEGAGADPYEHLLDADESGILAVVIDGRPRYGRVGFLDLDLSRQEPVVVGGKDFSLDLTEAGHDELAGLSLATAIAKLTDGLARLPELAVRAVTMNPRVLNAAQRDAFAIDFEFEEEDRYRTLETMVHSESPRVRPLLMSPITGIDDPDFIPALKANINLPTWLKNVL
jgi:cytosine/adenosine deaminase-related metal-dependent hydrolase